MLFSSARPPPERSLVAADGIYTSRSLLRITGVAFTVTSSRSTDRESATGGCAKTGAPSVSAIIDDMISLEYIDFLF